MSLAATRLGRPLGGSIIIEPMYKSHKCIEKISLMKVYCKDNCGIRSDRVPDELRLRDENYSSSFCPAFWSLRDLIWMASLWPYLRSMHTNCRC